MSFGQISKFVGKLIPLGAVASILLINSTQHGTAQETNLICKDEPINTLTMGLSKNTRRKNMVVAKLRWQDETRREFGEEWADLNRARIAEYECHQGYIAVPARLAGHSGLCSVVARPCKLAAATSTRQCAKIRLTVTLYSELPNVKVPVEKLWNKWVRTVKRKDYPASYQMPANAADKAEYSCALAPSKKLPGFYVQRCQLKATPCNRRP